jgi:hypothetical protein
MDRADRLAEARKQIRHVLEDGEEEYSLDTLSTLHYSMSQVATVEERFRGEGGDL